MTKFVINQGGEEYEVEAPDVATAQNSLKEHIQQEYNKEYIKSSNEAPEWAKPFIAASDVGMSGIDTLSAGLIPKGIDYLTGDNKFSQQTAASRASMGWAAPALDVAMISRFLPSLAPKATTMLGGGPATKKAVGATISGLEGATYGATDAATHDRDPLTGGLIGGGAGMGGSLLGDLANKGAKWWKGVDDVVPPTSIMKLPKNKTPTKKDILETAVNQANTQAAKVGGPAAYQDKMKNMATDLLTGQNRGAFLPGQRDTLTKISRGEPATRVQRMFGDFLSNKFIASGAGIAEGIASGGILPGLITAGGLSGAGWGMKKLAAGGTKDQVENLRRWVHGRHKFAGPISNQEKARIANQLRELGIELGPND